MSLSVPNITFQVQLFFKIPLLGIKIIDLFHNSVLAIFFPAATILPGRNDYQLE